MHKLLLCCICSLSLTACVYYGDIHGQAKPYTVAQLQQAHVAASAQPSAGWWHQFHNQTLNHLIAVALANSPNLQITTARLRKATQDTEAAASLRWPTLDFSGYVQRQKFAEFGLVPPPFNGRTFNIADAAFNFNYDVDLWGKNRQQWLAALSQQQAAAADVAQAQLMLSTAVASTYFGLQNLSAQTRLAQENVHLSEQLLQIARTRARQGIESNLPMQTLQINAQTAKQAYEQFKQQREMARHQLSVLLGDNPMAKALTMKLASYRPVTVTMPANLPASLLANRPDINAAKLRAEALAHQINVAKTRFYPNINLNGLFSYQAAGIGLNQFFMPQSQNNAVTAAFDLPLFDAGLRRANLGARYAEYDEAVNAYNQSILTALQQVADQLSTLHALRQEVQAATLAFKTMKQQYKLIHSRYNQGIADYMTLIESKQLLLQQQASLLNVQAQHQQATAAMFKALGGTDHISKG